MQVAVAVVSWNTRELLSGCLESLESAARAGLAEVWVLDNASSDGSAAMVRARFPWVGLIAGERNLGFGAGVNAVAERFAADGTQAEWLLAANADISLEPGALEAMLAAGDRDPRAGIIAPALVLADGSLEHSVHPFPGLRTSLALNLGLASLSPGVGRRLTLDGDWDQERARRGDWAHGACLLIRRRAFDDVGGFDAAQFLYAEDLDLAWRLARAGWLMRYEPAARVCHAGGASTGQLYGDRRDTHAQRAAYAWMRHRRGAARMRACALINLLGSASRAALASAPGATQRAGARGLEAWQLRRHTRMHLAGLLASRRSLRQPL